MKITSVRTRHANRSIWGHLAEREKTLPLVTPLDIYPQFEETRGSWFWDSGMAVVEIETEDGLVGAKKNEIRRIIVPSTVGYSEDPAKADMEPNPPSIEDRRALDSVLRNPRRDAAVLFDVKVVRIK